MKKFHPLWLPKYFRFGRGGHFFSNQLWSLPFSFLPLVRSCRSYPLSWNFEKLKTIQFCICDYVPKKSVYICLPTIVQPISFWLLAKVAGGNLLDRPCTPWRLLIWPSHSVDKVVCLNSVIWLIIFSSLLRVSKDLPALQDDQAQQELRYVTLCRVILHLWPLNYSCQRILH